VAKINRLGDDVSQNLLEWETVEDGVFTDGWDFLVVQLVVQLVDEVVTVSLDDTVGVWSVDLTTSNDWGVDVEEGLTSLTGDITGVGWDVAGDSWDVTDDGWDVTSNGLVDLWGEVLLLDEILEELLTDELTLNGINNWELLTLNNWDLLTDELTLNWKLLTDELLTGELFTDDLLTGELTLNWELFTDELLTDELLTGELTLNWELLGNNLLDWDDLLVNLDINDLGFLNNFTFTGDWLNNDLLGGGENLDVSLDLSDISNGWLVDVQVLDELFQKELVVDSLGGWVVLASEGWDFITARDHILLLLSVNVWENILVPDNEVIIRLTSEDVLLTIHILSISLLLVLVWKGVLAGEELDKWVDVLVEVDGVQEVLTEGRDLPEALEVDGSDVPLEDWVLDVLTEKWDGQVLTEELGVVDLFEGEDTVNIIDSTEELLLSVDEELLLLNWQDTVNDISNNGLFYWEALAQSLLQQEFIDNWTLEQGSFLGQTEGVQIQAASSYGCDECDKDEGFHDEFVN